MPTPRTSPIGTNNEFGFDYLRDNMKFSLEDYVQRDFHYAIVDEVDSILIDEARTPLIISGPAEESTQLYYLLDRVARQLKAGPGLHRGREGPLGARYRRWSGAGRETGGPGKSL